jgi:pimeloyl-ACP methyl ester carboxylesterase
MANFLLVHGGWRGGWVWDRCVCLLRSQGHRVYAPTLTGLGDRRHLLSSSINLSTHVQDVLNLIKYEQLNDIVLCGHSYAGMVITAVADAIPDKIASLVYLDAWLPSNGDCIATLAGPETAELLKSAGEHGGLAVSPIPVEVLNLNQSDRAMVSALCTPHPIATLFETVSLSGKHLSVPGKYYILATGWSPNPFEQFMMSVRGSDSWISTTLPTGHDAMLDDPVSVARLLTLAAQWHPQSSSSNI